MAEEATQTATMYCRLLRFKSATMIGRCNRYDVLSVRSYTTLLYYDDRPPPEQLKDWFDGYNARQTIEAGIKEGEGVFPRRHPWVHSPIGLQLQEQFSLFALSPIKTSHLSDRFAVHRKFEFLSTADDLSPDGAPVTLVGSYRKTLSAGELRLLGTRKRRPLNRYPIPWPFARQPSITLPARASCQSARRQVPHWLFPMERFP